MTKLIFAGIILFHGIIHLLGFAKSIKPGRVQQISSYISRPMGILWMVAAAAFILTFILWKTQSPYWSWVCLAAILFSQGLILTVWKDAKAGTVANLILLAVAWPEYGSIRFSEMLHAEQKSILAAVPLPSQTVVTDKALETLPPIVQQWLRQSGAVGKLRATGARLKQTGKMRMKPGSAWFDFRATQYYNIADPAFIWDTRVSLPARTFLTGRDKFEDGKGAMQIKLLSLINIVHESDHQQLNNSTAQRYLAEICWFPSAALEPYIQWESIDSLKAKATMHFKGIEAEGVFTFSEAGEFIRFETTRYYGNGADAIPAPWVIQPAGYKQMSGLKIPYKTRVTWKLDEGDFTWLELELTSLEINNTELY